VIIEILINSRIDILSSDSNPNPNHNSNSSPNPNPNFNLKSTLRENETNKNIVGTITAHHLLYNRNELFRGGICPHYYCLPILKREEHRVALLTVSCD
jgi:hypothetical protein